MTQQECPVCFGIGEIHADDDDMNDVGETCCPRCNGEGIINVEDRPFPNDISPSTHEEPCPDCS